MTRIITIAIFILVFILGGCFSAINATPVAINYYLGAVTLPLFVLVVLAIILGSLLSAIILSLNSIRMRYENLRLMKQLFISEQEMNNLRISPAKNIH